MVGVICVIPAAGLVAWVVRYVVRKKVSYLFCYKQVIMLVFDGFVKTNQILIFLYQMYFMVHT